MSEISKIEYLSTAGQQGASWNPLGWGCLGPGGTAEKPNRCPYCYAHGIANRHLRECPECQSFVPHFHEDELYKPTSWKKPRRIFLQSMGDLFGEGVTTEQIDDVLDIVGHCAQHTFLALTKSPQRMERMLYEATIEHGCRALGGGDYLPNLWLGTTITNQQDADERIPHLLNTPAATRWLSIEPLMGPVDLTDIFGLYEPADGEYALKVGSRWKDSPDWIVIGAESGNRKGKVIPKREWIESIVAQCRAAGVPIFMKSNLAAVWGESLIQEMPQKG